VEQGAWPIAIHATQDVACGVRLWSTAGRRRATVVVKATFFLVRGSPMRLVNPAPLLLGEQHHENNAERSVIAPSDLAPYLPRGEVILSGHAHAPNPTPQQAVRLSVVGARPLVDKTLHVYGERMWLEGDQLTAPVPFTRIPLRYERSSRGHVGYEENPVGMPRAIGQPAANIVDPQDPEAAAGFGAVASRWPSRVRLLRGLETTVLDQPEPSLPDTFAWSFFHVAPPDQRCAFFEGNEWIILEGLHAESPRFESQLPSAVGRARIYSSTPGFENVPLNADTLWIDGDRSLCCLTWRGNFEVTADHDLSAIQIFAGLDMPGRPVPWPEPTPSERRSPLPVEPTIGARGVSVPVSSAPQTAGSPMDLPVPPAAPTPGQGSLLAGLDPKRPDFSQTLASPSPRALVETVVRGRTPARTGEHRMNTGEHWVATGEQRRSTPQPIPAVVMPPTALQRSPDSITSVRVDPAWLEEAEQRALSENASISALPDAPQPSSGLSSTVTQAPSELRRLLANAAPSAPREAPSTPAPAELFEDSPTVAPDAQEIEAIVREAEARALANLRERRPASNPPPRVRLPSSPPENAPPPAPRESATGALRMARTTIRGLGSARDATPPSEPVPTASAQELAAKLGRESASDPSPFAGTDGPTMQHAVPEVLLKLAAGVGAAASPEATAPRMDPGPVSVAALVGPATLQKPPVVIDADVDDDDMGRPTLTGMESPISVVGPAPIVHRGETRMEVERRMREGEPLEGLDFSSLDLGGFDFSGKVLTGCKFDRATLTRCRFAGAVLRGASFRGAELGASVFDYAILEKASFAAAKLDGSSFRGANLSEASFAGAEGAVVIFDAATGQQVSFSRCELKRASFVGVQFDGADFTEAQCDGASFQGSLLPELRAEELSAKSADLTRATLAKARFTSANLSEAALDSVLAEDAQFDGCNLDGASLSGARLGGSDFARASLRGASLRHAFVAEARFSGADLSRANLTGIDLTPLTMDGANLDDIVVEI
jgi:uncharacterized protein YjbI with pentapeptide repeats